MRLHGRPMTSYSHRLLPVALQGSDLQNLPYLANLLAVGRARRSPNFDLIEFGNTVRHRRPLIRVICSVGINIPERRRQGRRKPRVTIALIWPMREQLLSCTACRCGTTEIAARDTITRAAKMRLHIST